MANGQHDIGIRIGGDASGHNAAVKSAGEEQKRLQKEFEQTGDQAKKSSEEGKRFADRLKDEAATVGKSRTEIERYRASQLQLTDAQKKSVEQSLSQIRAFERKERILADVRKVALLAATAITALTIATGALVKGAIDEADELNKLSQSLGASTEVLSSYRFQMQLAGVNAQQFSMGMRILAQRVSEAQSGIGEGLGAFKVLGTDVFQAAKRAEPLERLLPKIADAFAAAADGTNKTATAMLLFGESGARLIPWLNKGSAGMRELNAEAERMGVIIGADMAQKAEEFNDKVLKLTTSFTAFKFALAGDLLPNLTKFVDTLNQGAGLPTAINEALGTDRNLFNRELAEATDNLLRQQRNVERLRAGEGLLPRSFSVPRAERDLRAAEAEVARLRAIEPILFPPEPPPATPQQRPRRTLGSPRAPAGATEEAKRLAELQFQARQDEQAALFDDPGELSVRQAQEERRLALEKEAQAVRNAIDPWNAYRSEIDRLRALLDRGVISQREFGEAVALEAKKAGGELTEMTTKATDDFAELRDAIDGWGRDVSRDLAQAAASGELSFRRLGDAAQGFLSELLAIQIQRRIMDPALQAGTSFLNNLFTPSTPNAFLGNAAPFHSGGIVGIEGGARRYVHPAYFERAPRLHSGLAPDEYGAILQRGEGVFTPAQMRAMGGGNITVNVINETGAPVQAQASAPRFDATGAVVDLVLRGLATNGGAREQLAGMLNRPRH